MRKAKFALIGAGSASFCPGTVVDILMSDRFAEVAVEIYLMDIRPESLGATKTFAENMAVKLGRKHVTVHASTDLAAAVDGADFVVTAIDKGRFAYWAMDFHIPRRYGFRQIFGENGGPGGMFHALRNLPPLLEIARAMEKGCPDALMLNYSNPEAKLVEGVSRLTKIKAVGLCHGEQMGFDQLALFLGMPKARIGASPVGINHFGWFTRIWDKETGEDLYPRLRERERQANSLAHWEEYALARIMLRTYGLWSYPGTNHCGEYIAWSDAFLASSAMQFYHDPVHTDPCGQFIYSISGDPTNQPLFPEPAKNAPRHNPLDADTREPRRSGEYAIPIAEAKFFDVPTTIGSVNVPNKGYAPSLLPDMVIELPALIDGKGVHPEPCDPLPPAVSAMLNTQGTIQRLITEAVAEQSRNKLLQALLLDPTVSNYHNAVALINEMCERQKEVLPPMTW
ncbi:MAG: alpha-galactosidase [Phycisphaerae bacterium]|nr:alpha-galactosidase [Phycisphaerae bacterium]